MIALDEYRLGVESEGRPVECPCGRPWAVAEQQPTGPDFGTYETYSRRYAVVSPPRRVALRCTRGCAYEFDLPPTGVTLTRVPLHWPEWE